MGHDVFISYSSKDKTAADAVCAALESNGIDCWIAPRDIVPGETWASSILRGIEGCRAMVVVFSAHTCASPQICREVERAVHRGVLIAPIRIADVMPEGDLEFFLSSCHWMDALSPPIEKHLREFATKVKALLQAKRKPADGIPQSTPPAEQESPVAVEIPGSATLPAAIPAANPAHSLRAQFQAVRSPSASFSRSKSQIRHEVPRKFLQSVTPATEVPPSPPGDNSDDFWAKVIDSTLGRSQNRPKKSARRRRRWPVVMIVVVVLAVIIAAVCVWIGSTTNDQRNQQLYDHWNRAE